MGDFLCQRRGEQRERLIFSLQLVTIRSLQLGGGEDLLFDVYDALVKKDSAGAVVAKRWSSPAPSGTV